MTDRTNYSPDILNCLSNLSNDEVFTPPNIANDMLDLLPVEIWGDKNAKFLDPCTKSGVFLREIVKRLDKGLEQQFPDIEHRIAHILKNQVFGIAITELTSLIARRSVYCAKDATTELSIIQFSDEQGNIKLFGSEHDWGSNGKCTYCGVNKSIFDRGEELENHAYDFIHTETPEKLFVDEKGNEMKFDVIIGNPPYHMNTDGHGAQATPIYHKFIQQAKKLQPRYLSMIIPARWYAGGMGLNDFRAEMLNDSSLANLVDFPNAKDCFSGVTIKGGVCYFLWDRDNASDKCEITTMNANGIVSQSKRPLLESEMDTFIRYEKAVGIYKKVQSLNENTFDNIVSSQRPFGIGTAFRGNKNKSNDSPIKIYTTKSVGYVNMQYVPKNQDWVSKNKVYIPKAGSGGADIPDVVLGKPIVGSTNDCCSETYLLVGTFHDLETSKNVANYMKTKFFRFMVTIKKISQDCLTRVYTCVPMQDFSKKWTDEELYNKYKLTQDEIDYIESMIKPMELSDE